MSFCPVDVCKQKSRPRCMGNINFALCINMCAYTHIADARIADVFVFVQVHRMCD